MIVRDLKVILDSLDDSVEVMIVNHHTEAVPIVDVNILTRMPKGCALPVIKLELIEGSL